MKATQLLYQSVLLTFAVIVTDSCTKDNLVTYIHNDANILELKYWKPDGTELIAVMNFSGNPQENFHLRTTAPDTKLKEAINSNSSKYRGTNWFMNCQNNELSAQKVLVPPHSIVVFEK